MKRVLILSQFCVPEPDLKTFPIAKALKEKGYSVEILTGNPNYPGGKLYPGYKNVTKVEYRDGIKIIRVPLYIDHSKSSVKRILNYLTFAFSCIFIGIFKIKKPAVIYAYHAPATIAIPAIFFKLVYRSKIVYDINDYWPDTLTSTGMVKNQTLYNMVSAYCKASYKFFDKINVVSVGFKNKLLELKVPEKKISVIYNWSLPLGFSDSPQFDQMKHIFQDHFTVLYAGNIGYAQDLEVVTKTAQRLLKANNDKIRFIIIGSGVEKDKIKGLIQEHSLNNVLLLDQVPADMIGTFLSAADVLMLNLKDDPLFRITIPSKLSAYLSVGKPVLSGVAGESEELVTNAAAGKSFRPGDDEDMFNKLMELYNADSTEMKRMQENGKQFYEDQLSFEKGIAEFERIISQL